MDTTPCILTIDQGTTRQKVALIDRKGRCLAQETSRNITHEDADGSVQDAEDWWRSAARLTRSLVTSKHEVRAITVSGRGGAAVGIDDHGQVNANPWLDQRHRTHLDDLRNTHPDIATYAATLLAKLEWLRHHDQTPSAIMYAKDFIIYRLCGELVTDPTSGPDAATWPEIAMDLAGPVRLPTIAMPWHIVGELQQDAAETMGLAEQIPVVLGAHDGICANLGVGALNSETFALTLGTHCVTRCITPDVPSNEMFRFYGMPPDRHVVGANAWYAGRAIEWFLEQTFGAQIDKGHKFESLDRISRASPPGSGGATFFPYLGGQTSPRHRPRVREQFQGVTDRHTQEQLYQAVLEGSSFAIAESFAQMVAWLGSPVHVRVTGGGTANAPWLQMLADILGRSLQVSDALAECRGAAMFAAVALGEYSNYSEATVMQQIARTVDPKPERQGVYAELLQQWSEASAALPS